MIPLTRNITTTKSTWWLLMAWRLLAPGHLQPSQWRNSIGVYHECPTLLHTKVASVLWCLDCSTLVHKRHTAEACVSQPCAKECGPWNRLKWFPPGQNGRYFTEYLFKCIFMNAFSGVGLGFRQPETCLWQDVSQTVINHLLYIPPVSDRFKMFRMMMIMTHRHDQISGIITHNQTYISGDATKWFDASEKTKRSSLQNVIDKSNIL